MTHFRILTILLVTLVTNCVYGQYLNTNFENSNLALKESAIRDDSLMACSDSLYGIGISLLKQGKGQEALDYFKQSDYVDSLNDKHDWDYWMGILNSPKAWISYILYNMGKHEEAQRIISSYNIPHGYDVTAKELYQAQPFDRRIYAFKLDSLHKVLDADSSVKDIDRDIAEAKLMKNTYGESHYLYADYLWGIGNEYSSYHPNEALYYLYKAKSIIEKSPLRNMLLSGLEGSIAMTKNRISADSLLQKGIEYYKKGKYDKANVCFVKSYSLEVVPDARNLDENIRDVDRYEYPLMWLVNSYQKSNKLKLLPYTFYFEIPEYAKNLNAEDVREMDSLKRNAEENFKNRRYENAVKYYNLCNEKIRYTRDQLIIDLMKAYALQKQNKKKDPSLYKDISFFYDFTPIARNAVDGQDSLISYADGCFEHHYYASAAKYYQEIEKRFADKYGTDNCWYAFLKLEEASSYLKIYKSNDAKNCLLVAQPIFQKLLGQFNQWNTRCLQYLQDISHSLGQAPKALEYAEKLLFVKGQVDGKESESYLSQLSKVAFELTEVGRKKESVVLIDEVLNDLVKTSCKFHDKTMLDIFNRAEYCYRSAELYNQAYKCSEKIDSLTERDDFHSKYLIKKAKNLTSLNKLEEASKLCKLVDNNDVYSDVPFCSLLSDVYGSLDQEPKALKVLLEAKTNFNDYEKNNEYVDLLGKIADVYYKLGNISSSISYYEEAIDISKNHNGYKSAQIARLFKNISSAYMEMGRSLRANEYIDKAISTYRHINCQFSEGYAEALTIKASYRTAEGKFDSSFALLDSAITILRQIEFPYSKCILYKGYLPFIHTYYLDEQYREVNHICDDILNNIDKQEVNNTLYADVKAVLYKYKSLSAYKQKDIKNAIYFARQSLSMNQAYYGEDSKNYVDAEALLAEYMLMTNDSIATATKMAQHVTSFRESYVNSRFSDLTANDRTLLWNKNSEWFEKKIAKFVDVNKSFDPLSKLGYDAALYSKGILLSTEQDMNDIIEREGDVIAKNDLKQLRQLRLQINKQYEDPREKYTESITELEKKIDEEEKELSLQLKKYYHATKHIINWQDVQNVLGDKEAAIEFVSFNDADSIVYNAYLIKKNYKNPKVVRILKTDASVGLNKTNVYYTTWLSNQIWGKMADELQDVKSIYFAPTGDFYSIGIEALPLWNDSAKYVCDKWNIFRLSSTRQLVIAKPHGNYSLAAVYGGLKYKVDLNDIKDEVSGSIKDESSMRKEQTLFTTFDVKSLNVRGGISELPATYTEAVNIDKMLNTKGIPDKFETRAAGTEESFKRMSGIGYDLLHIATHGFYWDESKASNLKRLNFLQKSSDFENRSAEDKALTRSGLLLAGAANSILGLGLPKGAEDGVLTAGEVSQLNLSGLDLVVMSACQTGLGEVSGDGVFGLQRGFKKAGANTLLMSLCKVDDNATGLLMSHFYKDLLEKGMNKHDAFVDAQNYVRNYTITKNINVEKEISDADMKLMEQYGEDLPEPEDGFVRLTIQPYKDPRFWAVFILVDGLNRNIAHTSISNSKSLAANNYYQGSFDRWSGSYSNEWMQSEDEGPYGTIELHKNKLGHYEGRFKVNTDFNPIEDVVYGSISGDISGIEVDSTVVLSLKKFSIKDSTDKFGTERIKVAKGLFVPGDKIFKLMYKGNALFNIVPIGKMNKLLKYDIISTERREDE